MKRLHVHVGVEALDPAIAFYSSLFGAQPSVTKDDYAKWMLEDPKVNFAISTRNKTAGLDHLGIQVENDAELAELGARLHQAGEVFGEGKTTCCYAKSDKAWVRDPQGIAWEAFLTTGEATVYSEPAAPSAEPCCAPKNETRATACCAA